MLTLQMLKTLWPKGDSIVAGLIEGIATSAPIIFPKYGFNDLAIAHFMAQASEECGNGTEMQENILLLDYFKYFPHILAMLRLLLCNISQG